MSVELMLGMKTWAVVGANDDPHKFGNKIYKKLKSHGYEVYPVNPFLETVEGDKCYKDLSTLPKLPDVVNMVVSASRGIPIIKEIERIGIKNIWFQPGTVSHELIRLVEELKLVSVRACILTTLDKIDKHA